MIKTDLIMLETTDNEIFFTIGYLHGEDFFNCYPQYVPFRKDDDVKFKKMIGGRYYFNAIRLLNYSTPDDYFIRISQSKSYNYLDEDPFLGRMFRVKKSMLKKVINPIEVVKSVDKTTKDFIDKLAILLNVEKNSLGVTGTFAYGGSGNSSDFDVIIYGRDNCIKVMHRIKQLIKEKRHQLIKYNRIHHRLFNFNGKIVDPHFVLNPNEESILQQYSFIFKGYKELSEVIVDNTYSCFTPAIYKVNSGYFVTYAIGHRMLLNIGTELKIKVKLFEGVNKKTGIKENFYLWRMEDGWVDPTKEKLFNYRVYDIPKIKNE